MSAQFQIEGLGLRGHEGGACRMQRMLWRVKQTGWRKGRGG